MADVTLGYPAVSGGPEILLPMARSGSAGTGPPPPSVRGARGSRPPASADSWRDRQPEREVDRKCAISGYGAGRKVNGRKRHIPTDTEGFLVPACVHAADVRDRDGTRLSPPKRATVSPGCAASWPVADMPGTNYAARPGRWKHGASKSSGGPTRPEVSRSCRCGGSPCARSPGSGAWLGRLARAPGSGAHAGSQKTGRNPSKAPLHGSSPPTSGSSPGESQEADLLTVFVTRTLGPRKALRLLSAPALWSTLVHLTPVYRFSITLHNIS